MGVSNCYVFKSRLQEYAQKVGLPTPVYETIKEGPSHEPYFRSTVVVDNIRYDSLPGFYNRKAAEQSAAEVALVELAKSSEVKHVISVPVHETGLCKNLLQEYAQKMNYAIPLYQISKDGASRFICTVEIGGIRYIGTAATTKKEAELKAARTALLAIQSDPDSPDTNLNSNLSQLTVIPVKKRPAETMSVPEETSAAPKPKKAKFRKKNLKKKKSNDHNHTENEGNANVHGPKDGTDAIGAALTLQDGLVTSNSINGGTVWGNGVNSEILYSNHTLIEGSAFVASVPKGEVTNTIQVVPWLPRGRKSNHKRA